MLKSRNEALILSKNPVFASFRGSQDRINGCFGGRGQARFSDAASMIGSDPGGMRNQGLEVPEMTGPDCLRCLFMQDAINQELAGRPSACRSRIFPILSGWISTIHESAGR